MAVTPNLGLASPLASAVAGWIARLKADLALVDAAFAGAGENLLVNPNFNVWQCADRLGQGPWSAGNYAADRWLPTATGGSTLLVHRIAPGLDGSLYRLQATYAHAAAQRGTVEQVVEQWARLAGRAVSFRIRTKGVDANAVRAFISDGVAASFSAYHEPGGGAYDTLVVTHTLDAAPTTLRVGLYFEASTVLAAENASLVVGSVPLPCAPPDPQAELARCERYFEVHGWGYAGGGAGHPVVHGYAGAGGEVWRSSFSWAVRKGGLPTVSLVGTWALINASDVAVAGANEGGYALAITASAAGQCEVAPNSAADAIVGEWNPA